MFNGYQIYIDNGDGDLKPLFIPQSNEYILYDVVYKGTVGSAPSLTFKLPYSNPSRSLIDPLTTEFWLFKNNTKIFRGRYIGNTEDLYRTGDVTLEGDLNYLVDSIQEPYDHTGTIIQFVTMILNRHNAQVEARKQFLLGTINVVDSGNNAKRANADYSTTAEVFKNTLVDVHGGYFRIRYESNGNYLDYVTDYGGTNNQIIKFGENLIDITNKIDASSIITCLYPQGAQIEVEEYNDEYTDAEDIVTRDSPPEDSERESLTITTPTEGNYLIIYYYSSSCEKTEQELYNSISISGGLDKSNFIKFQRYFETDDPLIKSTRDGYSIYGHCNSNTTYTVSKLSDKTFSIAWTNTNPEVSRTYRQGERVKKKVDNGDEDVDNTNLYDFYEANQDINTPEEWKGIHWHTLATNKESLEGAASRLDIGLVNEGIKYITSPTGISKWGKIWGTYSWDDVTSPSNLLQKARAYLDDQIVLPSHFELTAFDLSLIGASPTDFKLGYWTQIESRPHELSGTYLLREIDIDISNPQNSKIILGDDISDTMSNTMAKTKIDAATKISQLAESLSMDITQAINNATALITGGLGGYVVMPKNPLSGYPEEILIMDSPDVNQAKNVIRLNRNGIGFSTTGYNGTYRNAWTIDGNLVADFITTGTLTAIKIQNANTGHRITLDESSSLKGYNGNTLVNLINMSQPVSGTSQMTIDALRQLNIRTPKIVVEDASHGEEPSTGTVTITNPEDSFGFECVTGKYYADESPVGSQEIVEGHWVYCNTSDPTDIAGTMYATLPAVLKIQKKGYRYINGMAVGKTAGNIYPL